MYDFCCALQLSENLVLQARSVVLASEGAKNTLRDTGESACHLSSDLKTGFAAKNSCGDGGEGKIMISKMIFQASLTLEFCKELQLTIPDYEKHVQGGI